MDENEENLMYDYLSEALISLCESKPQNALEFLSQKLFELSGNSGELIKTFQKKRDAEHPITKNEILITSKNSIIKKSIKQKNFDENYKIVSKLGIGSCGYVYKVHEINHPETFYAAKKISKGEKNGSYLSETKIESLVKLDSPYIAKIRDIFDEKDNLFIIEEFSENGDLLSYLTKKKIQITEKFVVKIVKDILRALIVLHDGKTKICHFNIKPSNLLVFDQINEINVKISDFASSQFYFNQNFSEIIGTPLYLSPEIINNQADEKSDIWSVGILAYSLLCGDFPFKGSDTDILFQVMNHEIKFHQNHTEEMVNFLSKLLQRDPKLRYSAKQALDDPYIEKVLQTELNSENSEVIKESFINMNNFLYGNNLKKSLLSFVMSRKNFEINSIELTKLFESIDKDHSGYIDEEEFVKYYIKYFPGDDEEDIQKIKQLMKSIDLNNSGRIDYTEFLIVSSQMNKVLSTKKIKEIFDFFDHDKKNFIEVEDLKMVFGDKIQSSKYQEMLDEYDVNGDKKLSFDEFIDLITKAD